MVVCLLRVLFRIKEKKNKRDNITEYLEGGKLLHLIILLGVKLQWLALTSLVLSQYFALRSAKTRERPHKICECTLDLHMHRDISQKEEQD